MTDQKELTDVSALKEVVDFVFDAAEGVAVLADGFQLKDLLAEGRVVADLPSLLKDAGQALPQYLALDTEAQVALVAYVDSKGVADSATAEAIVKKVLEIAIQLKAVVAGLLGLRALVKKA